MQISKAMQFHTIEQSSATKNNDKSNEDSPSVIQLASSGVPGTTIQQQSEDCRDSITAANLLDLHEQTSQNLTSNNQTTLTGRRDLPDMLSNSNEVLRTSNANREMIQSSAVAYGNLFQANEDSKEPLSPLRSENKLGTLERINRQNEEKPNTRLHRRSASGHTGINLSPQGANCQFDKTKEISFDNIKMTPGVQTNRDAKAVEANAQGLVSSFRVADKPVALNSSARQGLERSGIGETSRNGGVPHTTGFTFDEEVTKVQEMEEDVGNLASRINNADIGSEQEDNAHIEEEGSAHNTYDKQESCKSVTLGKIVSGIQTENSNSDYP